MTAKDVFHYSLTSTKQILNMFLADLDDADLQVRPVPGANTIAWQLGHLIAGEVSLGALLGIKYPALPPVLEPLSRGDSAKTHPDGGNLSKAHYLKIFNDVRDATIAGIAQVDDAIFEKPSPANLAAFVPKLGDIGALLGNHAMMHVGQFTIVRRLLGKPVVF